MKLAEYRIKTGKSRADCAAELDVGVPTYWKWETGHSTPSAANIREIVEWSGGLVTERDLIGVKQ